MCITFSTLSGTVLFRFILFLDNFLLYSLFSILFVFTEIIKTITIKIQNSAE